MASRPLLLLRAPSNYFIINPQRPILHQNNNFTRKFSANPENGSPLESRDLTRLSETARITLTPQEVEEFAPKIQQVIDWFGQLQAVDLNTVEPALRAEAEGDNLRDDIPETFEKMEPIIAGVPSYEEPYIKVPKVLNKESNRVLGILNWIIDLGLFHFCETQLAEIEGDNLRDDIPETFVKTEPIIAGVPSYEVPYIKVPKVLNKE